MHRICPANNYGYRAAQAWHFRQPLHRCVMPPKQARNLPVQLIDMFFDHFQMFQRHLQHLAIDRVEVSRGAQRIAQLRLRRLQSAIGHCSQNRRLSFAFRQTSQHSPCALAKQIGNHTRQLDVRFLEETLHLVLQPHLVPRQLMLAMRHGTPQTLFRIRNET